MRITEANEMLAAHYAQIRPHDSGSWRAQPADQARGAATGAGLLSVLDTDHDGWLDEDDVPYDHLVLRERELRPATGDAGDAPRRGHADVGARRGDADVGATYTRAATSSPVVAGEVRSSDVDPKAPGGVRVGPQIDLLA